MTIRHVVYRCVTGAVLGSERLGTAMCKEQLEPGLRCFPTFIDGIFLPSGRDKKDKMKKLCHPNPAPPAVD